MAFDEGLAQRIREHWSHNVAFNEKRMFGGLAFLIREHMVVGILGDSLMARVGRSFDTEALALPHVKPMDFTGRLMRGIVIVMPGGFETDAQLAMWLDRCRTFVSELPDKQP